MRERFIVIKAERYDAWLDEHFDAYHVVDTFEQELYDWYFKKADAQWKADALNMEVY